MRGNQTYSAVARAFVLALIATAFVVLRAPVAEAQAAADTELLSAHPERDVAAVYYRGAMRGVVALRVPLLSPERHGGFGLRVLPLIELHNDPGSTQPLPNQNWRGRLALASVFERAYTARVLHRVDAALLVQHESDHETARTGVGDDALQLNDLAMRGGVELAFGESVLRFGGEGRVFAISCTRVELGCENFRGSSSVGASLDVVFDMGGAAEPPAGFRFFAALHAGGILGRGELAAEGRGILQLGARVRAETGLFQLFLVGLAGNEVGFDRTQRVLQGGGGVGYAY